MNPANLLGQRLIFDRSLTGPTKPPLPVVIAAGRNLQVNHQLITVDGFGAGEVLDAAAQVDSDSTPG